MKKISTLFVALLSFLPLLLSSCDMDIDEWVPDEKADARYSLKTSLSIDAEVYQSDEDKFEVVCSEDLAPFVKVVKKDSTYIATFDFDKVEEVYGEDERFSQMRGVTIKDNQLLIKGIPFKGDRVLVRLGLKDLRGLCAASSSSIICKGEWAIDTLSLASHSDGNIKFDNALKAKCLAIKSSSSGYIKGAFELKENVDIKLSSGAELDCQIKANEVTYKGSSGSSSKLKLNTSKGTCSLSSGADTELTGQARELNLKASSGADIKGYIKHESLSTHKSSGGSIDIQMLDKADLVEYLK